MIIIVFAILLLPTAILLALIETIFCQGDNEENWKKGER